MTSTNGLAAGMSNNSAYAEKCGNTGTIKGYANVSGSMGVAGINNSTGASFCYNTGKISALINRIGRMVFRDTVEARLKTASAM